MTAVIFFAEVPTELHADFTDSMSGCGTSRGAFSDLFRRYKSTFDERVITDPYGFWLRVQQGQKLDNLHTRVVAIAQRLEEERATLRSKLAQGKLGSLLARFGGKSAVEKKLIDEPIALAKEMMLNGVTPQKLNELTAKIAASLDDIETAETYGQAFKGAFVPGGGERTKFNVVEKLKEFRANYKLPGEPVLIPVTGLTSRRELIQIRPIPCAFTIGVVKPEPVVVMGVQKGFRTHSLYQAHDLQHAIDASRIDAAYFAGKSKDEIDHIVQANEQFAKRFLSQLDKASDQKSIVMGEFLMAELVHELNLPMDKDVLFTLLSGKSIYGVDPPNLDLMAGLITSRSGNYYDLADYFRDRNEIRNYLGEAEKGIIQFLKENGAKVL